MPFAAGNILGPLLLGPLFDTLGIAALFNAHARNAVTIMAAWCVIFFFASAGASAAYLAASAIVYSLGTLIGGVGAPYLFGTLIATKSVIHIVFGYILGAACMLIGGVVE